MTFKITVTQMPIGIEFEVGSLAEAIGILEQEDTALRKVMSLAESLATDTEGTVEAPPVAGEAPKGRGRGRPAKDKNQPDPATATAPAPLPVPPPAALAAPDTTPGPNGIPAFLDRTAAAAAAAPPPPPAPPPAAPVVPPSGILAGKVIANLDERKAATADNGAGLVAWLAAPTVGLVNPGVSYDEAIAVIRLIGDDKLGSVATALSVS